MALWPNGKASDFDPVRAREGVAPRVYQKIEGSTPSGVNVSTILFQLPSSFAASMKTLDNLGGDRCCAASEVRCVLLKRNLSSGTGSAARA